MIKKRVLYGLLIFFGKIHTMELIQKVEQLVSSPEGKSVEDTMVNFVKSPTGQNILQEVETKAESLFSHSTATSATTTTAMTTTLKRSAITTATTATTTTTSTTPTIVVNNDTAVHNAINQNQQSLSSSSQIKNVQEKAPLSKSNQPSNQVPNLQLNNALPLTTALSGSLKTPNKNIDQLSKNIKHVKAAQTARDN
ncbi:MAG TPA: hypothetical protein VHX42_03500, partial [Candidatus Babeliales bacterium]|nr:hypothetical protein [Candidatus Babeliales bacterium]